MKCTLTVLLLLKAEHSCFKGLNCHSFYAISYSGMEEVSHLLLGPSEILLVIASFVSKLKFNLYHFKSTFL